MSDEKEVLRRAQALTGDADRQSVLAAIRRQMPQPARRDFVYAREVTALLDILRRNVALTSERDAVRAIGKRLDSAGGFEAMQAVAAELRRQFPVRAEQADGIPPRSIARGTG